MLVPISSSQARTVASAYRAAMRARTTDLFTSEFARSLSEDVDQLARSEMPARLPLGKLPERLAESAAVSAPVRSLPNAPGRVYAKGVKVTVGTLAEEPVDEVDEPRQAAPIVPQVRTRQVINAGFHLDLYV